MKDGDNVLAVRIDNNWQYREVATKAKFQWNDRNLMLIMAVSQKCLFVCKKAFIKLFHYIVT